MHNEILVRRENRLRVTMILGLPVASVVALPVVSSPPLPVVFFEPAHMPYTHVTRIRH